MSHDQTEYSKLAEEILRWWQIIRCFHDLERHNPTLHALLICADEHLQRQEWEDVFEACAPAFSLLESRKPFSALDSALHDSFAYAVVDLYCGIAFVGCADVEKSKGYLQASARVFDLNRFPLGAGLAYIALGKVFVLRNVFADAEEYLKRAQESLSLGYLIYPDSEIQSCKQKLEERIKEERKALGEKIASLQSMKFHNDQKANSHTDAKVTSDANTKANPYADQKPNFIPSWDDETFEKLSILETEVAAFAPGRNYVGEDQIGVARFGAVVVIEDQEYFPVDLINGKKILYLDRTSRHPIIRVRGISMNRSSPVPIEDGAWIVTRIPASGYDPSNDDIVVANIPEISGDKLLLKRFEATDGIIFLKSETSEPDLPEHQPRTFDRETFTDQPVRIVAQAIAVLEPIGKLK
jgi:hypothetical protein